MEFARAHFVLSRPDEKSGKTRLQILIEIKTQTGIIAPELRDIPRLPGGSEHVWRWYNDLDAKRTAGFSMNPITWSDTHAYFTLTGVRPHPWELRALSQLDNAYIASRIGPAKGAAKDAKSLKRSMTGKAAL